MPPSSVTAKGTRALNESPSEKEGKSSNTAQPSSKRETLNESPSEKEGKWRVIGSFWSLSIRPQ